MSAEIEEGELNSDEEIGKKYNELNHPSPARSIESGELTDNDNPYDQEDVKKEIYKSLFIRFTF